MFRYLLIIIVFGIFNLYGVRLINSDNYDDFLCDHDWMDGSRLDWLKRCIEYENRDVNEQSASRGSTALHSAALMGDVASIKYLIQRGAKLEIRDYVFGETPLHKAAFMQNSGALRLLLDSGANVNATTFVNENDTGNGRTALRYSLARRDTVSMRILLAHGADVNGDGMNNHLPKFMYFELTGINKSMSSTATFKMESLVTAICELLIDAGADVDAKFHGRSSRDLALNYVESIDNQHMKGCVELVLSR